MAKLILALLLSLPLFAFAEQPVQKGDRVDDAKIIQQMPSPAVMEAMIEDAAGVQVTTVLEPVFQELEDRYRAQIDEVAVQIATARPDQQETLERRIMELKLQQTIEHFDVVLNYVRQQGNREAEARVLDALEKFNNPSPVQRVTVRRDPNTGAELEGGAR